VGEEVLGWARLAGDAQQEDGGGEHDVGCIVPPA